MSSETYMRFLKLVSVIESQSSLEPLKPIETSLLRIIAIANFKNERLSVKDLMKNADIASPLTIHRCIHNMAQKDWIELAPTQDLRRLQIRMTPRALKHFDRIGKAAMRAAAK